MLDEIQYIKRFSSILWRTKHDHENKEVKAIKEHNSVRGSVQGIPETKSLRSVPCRSMRICKTVG